MNSKVDVFFTAGCGRCSLFNTPECKVRSWTAELEKLREIILGCELLTEELKWGVPVYTFGKNNVALISAFKENCVLSFFKGVLLKDADKILTKQGENSQAARVVRFTNLQQIIQSKNVLKDYLREAIEIEKAGLKVNFKPTSEYKIPIELQNKLNADRALKNAFGSLTPGRQRAYILHFSQSKQSKSRAARIEKYMPKILVGKGLRD